MAEFVHFIQKDRSSFAFSKKRGVKRRRKAEDI
jgi:hypothetical protein